MSNLFLLIGMTERRVEEQLADQGYALEMEPLARAYLQRDVDEVARLFDRGVITGADADRAKARIIKKFQKHIKPIQ
jgi:ribosomal protein S20